jgi:oligopeptide transport system permease protein
MIKVIAGRLLQLIPVLWILLTLTFFMTKIVPGGPFSAERQATPEVIAQLNAYYGLDKPVWQQYLGYLSKVARFDFGPSYTYHFLANWHPGVFHCVIYWSERRCSRGG